MLAHFVSLCHCDVVGHTEDEVSMEDRKGRRPVSDKDRSIARNLRSLRTEKNITCAEAARLMGVSLRCYYRYEKGDNRLSASQLHTIATALDVPLCRFFKGDDNEQN